MLGAATVRVLVQEGYEVVAVARPGSSRLSNIPADDKVSIVELGLEDIGSLPDVLKQTGAEDSDMFFHFAWDGTHGDSRNDTDIQLSNIRSSIEAVRAAAALKCSVFLGAGSQAEYGRVPSGTKLSGDTPCFPENGYGAGKLCAGQMTRIEARKYGMRHIWCRILSVYGPYDGDHTMVMSMIRAMIDGRKASCTKGEQLWDYLYCDDAARAFYLAALKGRDGAVYPVGSGTVRQLSEYIGDIRDAIDPVLPIGFGEVDYYPGQVMYLCADISGLSSDTGFKPGISFDEGIRRTVEWYRKERMS